MIYILGLDGLEYSFVERWNCENLRQGEYGKVRVPINEQVGLPLSPEVWASFLTGKHVCADFKKPVTPLSMVFRFLKFMRRHTGLSFGLSKRIRDNVPMEIHGQYTLGFPTLKDKTFLDLTNSEEINVPYYNHDNAVFEINQNFAAGSITLKQAVEMLKDLYEKSKSHILHVTEILQDVDVVFAYMNYPDALQHYLFTKPSEIRKHYLDLNSYVSDLKSTVENFRLFIIVSDHGFSFETESHSKHGFYSSNVNLGLINPKITDFFDLVVRT